MWLSAVVVALAPLAQSVHWQRASMRRARRFLDGQRTMMASLFTAEDDFEESLQHRKLALTRELHLAEMVHDIGIAQREAVRDDWAQHSQYIQNLMMMASLVFSLISAVFCEASIPVTLVDSGVNASSSSESDIESAAARADAIALVFALLCGLGVSSSLGCLWLCLVVQRRMADFDFHSPAAIYNCGRMHFEFEDYHECHCKQVEWFTHWMFLVSVTTTVAAGCLAYAAGTFDASVSTAVAATAAAVGVGALAAVTVGAVHLALMQEGQGKAA